MVSSVGFADCEAMALIGHSSVLSTALPKNRNFPHTCWMNFLPFLSNGGDVVTEQCGGRGTGEGGRGMRPRGIGDAASVAVSPERRKNPLNPPEEGVALSLTKNDCQQLRQGR